MNRGIRLAQLGLLANGIRALVKLVAGVLGNSYAALTELVHFATPTTRFVARYQECEQAVEDMEPPPRGLDPPTKILIIGTRPDMSAKTVLSVYEQPVYGRFWVTQTVPKVTDPAWIESQTNNPTGCSEDSVVTLRNGTRAALSAGRHGTSIMWLDHGVLIDVYGQTFTKVQAIELANQV